VNGEAIRRNQDIFREVNERIDDITSTQQEATSEFLCECGQQDCTLVVELRLDEYRQIRSGEDRFIVFPGHCVEGVDRLAESRDGFDVVVQI